MSRKNKYNTRNKRIEKKNPIELLAEWRKGLSAKVKQYYLERKSKPWLDDI